MATQTLSGEQENLAKKLLSSVRAGIAEAAKGDPRAEFAIRRYIYIRLQYDERGNPQERKRIKMRLFDEQGGKCAICEEPFRVLKDTHLHRKDPHLGYAKGNVELVHASCHRREQDEKGYK